MDELQQKILEIVKEKHLKTGGRNGNYFGDFDHILNLPLKERNTLLEFMATKQQIVIKEGINQKIIMLPKQ